MGSANGRGAMCKGVTGSLFRPWAAACYLNYGNILLVQQCSITVFANFRTIRFNPNRIDEFRMVLGGQATPFCFYPFSRVTRNCETHQHLQLQIQRTKHIKPDFPSILSDVLRTISLSLTSGRVKKLLFANSVVKKHGVGWPPKTMRNLSMPIRSFRRVTSMWLGISSTVRMCVDVLTLNGIKNSRLWNGLKFDRT